LKVIHTAEALGIALNKIQGKGNFGFIPTMGALHEGHISLVKRSIIENEFTICSIFVNQKQFNNTADFEKYPSTIESDLAKLASAKCDIAFVPTNDQIYPKGFISPYFALGNIENVLEGFYRPGHFQGVCIVVNRLLDLIKPSKMYLGLKDYQQCMVIQKMLELIGLDKSIKLCFVETIRDVQGLALSSRNLRLSEDAKRKALVLMNSLKKAKDILIKNTNAELSTIKAAAIKDILNAGFESVDYFDFIDQHFDLIKSNEESKNTIAILTAATIEGVRLIDNIQIYTT